VSVVSQFIPEDAIQEVLLRVDIVEVIGDYVTLKKSGTNYKGLCPFHSEKTPSFTVSPTKGLFYCFGCQASGNVFRFLMRQDSLSFPEAVRLLADRYGVRRPPPASTTQSNSSMLCIKPPPPSFSSACCVTLWRSRRGRIAASARSRRK
jgi:DNA primase catalytic core